MKQRVVIIGHGYTSRLGMIRALGSEGYEVVVIVMTPSAAKGANGETKPIDCYSRYVSEYFFCPSDREVLVQLLLEKCTLPDQKVVVVPDSDFSAATIDLFQERLSSHFLFPHIEHRPGKVVEWMDKQRQKQTASEVGLNVAKCWIVQVVDEQYSIPSDIQYPCFPKPLATIVGGKDGLKRCDDESALRMVIEKLAAGKPSITIMVEEFKNIETEYAVLGYSDGVNVNVPGVIKILSLANGGHFGVAKQGVIMPVTGFENLIEKFKSFVRETGFVGIFDIDFYSSGGSFYFGEMNLRYGGSGYAVTKSGVNLPQMLVENLTGHQAEAQEDAIAKAAVYVNERMCKDDWSEGYISTYRFVRLLRNADIHFIKDPDDPEPQKQFIKSCLKVKKNAKRLVKRILKCL